MNKEEVIKQYKSLFPDNVEAIILTKEEYDKQLGKLQYENIELKLELENLNKEWEDFLTKTPTYIRIEKAIEYIENNDLYEEVIDDLFEENPIYLGANCEKARNDLLNILKGGNNE